MLGALTKPLYNNRYYLFLGANTAFFFAWSLDNMNIFPSRVYSTLASIGIITNKKMYKLPALLEN